jgi:uncharacterized protein (TIGR02301 family)
MRLVPLAIAFVLVAAGSAPAQDRTPALRQTLVDLAYVLGESHALRQACEGAGDQFWRTRMIRMTDVEAPDETLDARLKESFNTGYASRQGEFPSCTPASRQAEASAAIHGRDLAAKLARATVPVAHETLDPDAIADDAAPR